MSEICAYLYVYQGVTKKSVKVVKVKSRKSLIRTRIRAREEGVCVELLIPNRSLAPEQILFDC